MPLIFVEFFENLLYFDRQVFTLEKKDLFVSLHFERDNKESGVTQPDEVWLCEGADSFRENLAAKVDLIWHAKDEKQDALLHQ